MKTIVLLFVITLLTVSCASLEDAYVSPRYASGVQSATKIEKDPYAGVIIVKGPIRGAVIESWLELAGADFTMFDIRGFADNASQPVSHLIHFEIKALDWLFLTRAYMNGVGFDLIQIDSEVLECRSDVVVRAGHSCTVREVVALAVTGEHLSAAATEGFDIKLSGSRGQRIVKIPATYVQGYLAAIEQGL